MACSVTTQTCLKLKRNVYEALFKAIVKINILLSFIHPMIFLQEAQKEMLGRVTIRPLFPGHVLFLDLKNASGRDF